MKSYREYLCQYLSSKAESFSFNRNVSGKFNLADLKAELEEKKESYNISSMNWVYGHSIKIEIGARLSLQISSSEGPGYFLIMIRFIENRAGIWINTFDAYESVKTIITTFLADEPYLKNMETDFQKKEKIKTVASHSIETLLKSILKDSGYFWNLRNDGETYSTLEIKISHKRFIKLKIHHKDFEKKIMNIKKIIEGFEQLEKENGMHLSVQYYGNRVRWNNGSK